MAMKMNVAVFLDVTPCGLVYSFTNILKDPAAFIFRVLVTSALKAVPAGSSESLVPA